MPCNAEIFNVLNPLDLLYFLDDDKSVPIGLAGVTRNVVRDNPKKRSNIGSTNQSSIIFSMDHFHTTPVEGRRVSCTRAKSAAVQIHHHIILTLVQYQTQVENFGITTPYHKHINLIVCTQISKPTCLDIIQFGLRRSWYFHI